ncbi:hypothetical protein F2P58_23400 [Vibrio fortis]|uniref:Uncharacterized protein n=1 Tax=Vibrio fortis TaxID=212667 RepID=A0A5N3QUX0_9VIBR|nr:hypothetical protein [Vibrio fortis]KAB0285462.1 hypothetical protein F2P58_23400 [Vibrio fortis]
MTLQELVMEEVPELRQELITHLPLCDIFTIVYGGVLIGYYNPTHNELRLNRTEINNILGGHSTTN